MLVVYEQVLENENDSYYCKTTVYYFHIEFDCNHHYLIIIMKV